MLNEKDLFVRREVETLVRGIVTALHDQRNCLRSSQLALFAFLLRIFNSWRSVGKLLDCCENETEFTTIANDGAAIIRCMYDALIQAMYIADDPSVADERGQLYLDFEHIEQHKLTQEVVRQMSGLARYLAMSPLRSEGERRNQEEFDRVKDRYLVSRRGKDGSAEVRNHWYVGDLRELARGVGKEEEYVFL
jgi:hypothetical protein